ncbi:MAG: FtsX-like permease family protein [Rikenellaceae bacterium]
MIRLLLKRIYTQRKSNIWLLLSCFFISLLLFSLVDTMMIVRQTSELPQGITFDKENTYVVSVGAANNILNDAVDSGAKQTEYRKKAIFDVMDMIKSDPSVEKVAFYMPLQQIQFNLDEDDEPRYYRSTMVDSTFFDIIQPNVLATLSDLSTKTFKESWNIEGERPIIIDRSMANHLIIDTLTTMKQRFMKSSYAFVEQKPDEVYQGCLGESVLWNISGFRTCRIVSVFDTYADSASSTGMCYLPIPYPSIGNFGYMPKYVVKMKPGSKFNLDTFAVGHFYLQSVKLYTEEIRDNFDRDSLARLMGSALIGAFFFLFNLIIGIMGSFWYRTNARTKDIGVQLSLGASPRTVLFEFIGEAMLILIIALIPTIIITMNQFNFGLLVNVEYTPITVGRYLASISVTIALMVGMMLLGVIYPTIRATKINPATAVTTK